MAAAGAKAAGFESVSEGVEDVIYKKNVDGAASTVGQCGFVDRIIQPEMTLDTVRRMSATVHKKKCKQKIPIPGRGKGKSRCTFRTIFSNGCICFRFLL